MNFPLVNLRFMLCNENVCLSDAVVRSNNLDVTRIAVACTNTH